MSTALLSCVTSEGGLLPPEILQRILAQDRGLPGLSSADYHLDVRLGEAASRAWTALQPAWRAFRAQLEKLSADETGTSVTREKWLLPLFRELGFGWLTAKSANFAVDGETYPFSHGYGHVPIHMLGALVSLDKKEQGLVGAARMSPHGLVQQFLNRSEAHLWGIVSNGLSLRLLRDHYSLSSAAYLEFDLEGMFDGGLYSEFLLLFLLLHQSRVEAAKASETWLEVWFKASQEDGVRALDRLRGGVEAALTALGTGFLKHPENGPLRDALKHGRLGRDGYFRELLRVLYRILFLFVAEDRQALLAPDAAADTKQRFSRYYGTRRLRELAFGSRGTAHHDLWEQLRLVFAGLWEGEPALALPALGSGLFDPHQLVFLSASRLSNVHLLAALRALAEVTEGGRRIRVSYRNLGAQELGSVYESLLELHPALNVDAGTFELTSAPGHERKTTGSYYTPVSLVECLLDTALDPVIDQAVKGKTAKQAESALLDLKVCDPACGSGHFLVAAARRIADRLARVRAPEEEPSPAQRQHALRDVVGHCVFGVDVNPMAVELCKVSLWMEAIEPGRPLSFLDAHIQCGNALLGTTPALLGRGIPDEAFDPLEGDDKAVSVALRKQNRKERSESVINFGGPPPSTYVRIGNSARAVDMAPDSDLESIRSKELKWAELLRSGAYESARLLADLWCAAFVWPKRSAGKGRTDPLRGAAPTDAAWRKAAADPSSIGHDVRAESERAASQYSFFHWHLAFPQVLRPMVEANDPCGWEGGFDLVLGNPPWDKIQIEEQHFFASSYPDIASADARRRKKMIEGLETSDPTMFEAYQTALRQSLGTAHHIKTSGRFPFSGRGNVTTHAVFLELALGILDRTRLAHLALLLPSGLATQDSQKELFAFLVDGRLRVFFDFENGEGLFPAVHKSFHFATVAATSLQASTPARFSFFLRNTQELNDPGRVLSISPEYLSAVSPNTRSCPLARTQRDLDLLLAICRAGVPLQPAGASSAWGWQSSQIFNETHEAQLLAAVEPGPVDESAARSRDVLYEAKLLHQFDHRYATYDGATAPRPISDAEHNNPNVSVRTRWSVPRSVWDERVAPRNSGSQWVLAFRRIARATDERTFIAAILPRCGAGSQTPVVTISAPPRLGALLFANLNSMPFDFAARLKSGGTDLNHFVVNQLFAIAPSVYEEPKWAALANHLRNVVCELVFTAWDLAAFAHDLGYTGPPFMWEPARRALLRAEVDAAYFHLYGLRRDDAEYVIDTFPIVKRRDEEQFGEYRTKRLVLECYDAMAEAAARGTDYRTKLDPPPGDPRAAHAPRTLTSSVAPANDIPQSSASASLEASALAMDDDTDLTENSVEEDEGEESVVHPYDPSKNNITTKLMTLDLLVKRVRENEIDLMPDFQRHGNLWSDERMSLLIESLLIRLPLPVFYFDASDDSKWLVVDGLQRLSTLKRFIIDKSLSLRKLEYLRSYENKKYDDLPRDLQRRIEETQVTVHLIQPGTPPEVKYNIFRRINTGGLVLTAQEIRHALNPGKVAGFLAELAEHPSFVGATSNGVPSNRMLDREFALRFAAFYLVPYSTYAGPMDWFLTQQMATMNKLSNAQLAEVRTRFVAAMQAASTLLGRHAFRKRFKVSDRRKPINKALFEAWSVALARISERDAASLAQRKDLLSDRFMMLMNQDAEFLESVTQATGDPVRVKKRFATIETLVRNVAEAE